MSTACHVYISDNTVIPYEEFLGPIALHDWEGSSAFNVEMALSVFSWHEALGFPRYIVYHVV